MLSCYQEKGGERKQPLRRTEGKEATEAARGAVVDRPRLSEEIKLPSWRRRPTSSPRGQRASDTKTKRELAQGTMGIQTGEREKWVFRMIGGWLEDEGASSSDSPELLRASEQEVSYAELY